MYSLLCTGSKLKTCTVGEVQMDACGAGVAVLDNKLYVVGGSQGRTASSMCQVYEPASNSWSKVAELNTGE